MDNFNLTDQSSTLKPSQHTIYLLPFIEIQTVSNFTFIHRK